MNFERSLIKPAIDLLCKTCCRQCDEERSKRGLNNRARTQYKDMPRSVAKGRELPVRTTRLARQDGYVLPTLNFDGVIGG